MLGSVGLLHYKSKYLLSSYIFIHYGLERRGLLLTEQQRTIDRNNAISIFINVRLPVL